LSVLFAGCGASPPLHYYALAAVMPLGPVAAHATAARIRVRHVSLPPEIDHRGLTHHLGPNQLTVSDADQWSAPLADLIQGTVTRDLGQRLGFEQVVAPASLAAGSQPDLAQASLDLDFVALSADATCAITAQVNWTLSRPAAAVQRGTLVAAAPASACPSGLPGALSTALGVLTDQLVPLLPVR
jgi:uncharacterized lipoprotein YmbA